MNNTFVTSEIANDRRKICNQCGNSYINNVNMNICNKCNCNIELKTILADAQCPIQLWFATSK